MANTYTKIFLHLIFAVSQRKNLIPKNHKEEIQKYATGIIQNRNQKLLAINCMPDHIHILIGYKPTHPIPDLVRDIKACTSKFINQKTWMKFRFEWQKGYGCFSTCPGHYKNVVQYIMNQEEHHQKKSFKQEYLEFLNEYDVQYDTTYLFEWIDDD